MNESFETQSRIEKGLKLNPSREATPKQVINSIQPIFISNRPLPQLRQITDLALNDSDKTITVPENKTWDIHWIFAQLITTATAGNRNMLILILDPSGNVLFRQFASALQIASTTERYNYIKGIAEPSEVVAAVHNIPLPTNLMLPAGYQIQILDDTGVAATADDLSIFIMVEEYDYSMF